MPSTTGSTHQGPPASHPVVPVPVPVPAQQPPPGQDMEGAQTIRIEVDPETLVEALQSIALGDPDNLPLLAALAAIETLNAGGHVPELDDEVAQLAVDVLLDLDAPALLCRLVQTGPPATDVLNVGANEKRAQRLEHIGAQWPREGRRATQGV